MSYGEPSPTAKHRTKPGQSILTQINLSPQQEMVPAYDPYYERWHHGVANRSIQEVHNKVMALFHC